MENIIKYLNANPGIGIIVAVITVVGTIVGWFIKKDKQKNMDNSSHIHVGGSVTSGGNTVIGNSNTIGASVAPEFHLQLYGSGAKREIEGHIEKQGGQSLVAETIEIDGLITDLNQQFTRLFPLKNLNFSSDLFTVEKQNIMVRVVYRTLDGKKYEYCQEMSQQPRADSLFNVSLTGSPTIREIV